MLPIGVYISLNYRVDSYMKGAYLYMKDWWAGVFWRNHFHLFPSIIPNPWAGHDYDHSFVNLSRNID
jgi:hypothetical protein